jgi:hypothetical protein
MVKTPGRKPFIITRAGGSVPPGFGIYDTELKNMDLLRTIRIA